LRGALRFGALALLVVSLTLAVRRPPKALPRREVPRISFYDRTGSVDLSAGGHARAEHFLRQAEQQVRTLLCGERRETCPALEGRRLRVVTTLDPAAQEIVERWIFAGRTRGAVKSVAGRRFGRRDLDAARLARAGSRAACAQRGGGGARLPHGRGPGLP